MNEQRKFDIPEIRNESVIAIKPIYTAEDVAASRIDEPGVPDGVGMPGQFPFTRGIHDMMYRKRPWTMRQYTGFANAADTNERFKYLIETGNTGLNVAFDLPTQCGHDSDDPLAAGEVGRVGMAIDTLKDMEVAFDDIDIQNITVSLTINGSASTMIAMYLAMAEKRGFDTTKLRGTCQNDILKEFVGRGTWIYPVEPSVKLVADTMEYCAEHAPLYSPVSVCGYHIRESGATPTEEMAYGFAIASAYFDEVLKRGLDIDDFAYRMSFNYNIFGQFFEQICKFRAGRRLWAKIVKADHRATGKQHYARCLLCARLCAFRRPDHRALLLRRGLHDPLAPCAADLDPHHAASDRGDGPDRHRRSARRLLLCRDPAQRDGRGNGQNHGRDRGKRRHRQDDCRGRTPVARFKPGLPASARTRIRRDS
jgi:methylmalonyl-CoA mutase N-terminal domain/subunit